MYEVTYNFDGIIKKININGRNANEIQSILTSMFSGQKIQVINIRKI